ncbi:hypothetical protein [Planifilum fimeticola]|uniref:hypothetical protein n=1 Tax=Planifilum fimeticola TaxID=201975 RepID=UPI001B808BC8|nr:hypothetical protein [Planifilum fimeticola]
MLNKFESVQLNLFKEMEENAETKNNDRRKGSQATLRTNQSSNRKANSSTFSDNMSLPIHRWFRYSAGFSAIWVNQLIEQEKANGRCRILDPFAGSGTVLLEGERCNVETIGIEAHPFVSRIARAKLYWRESPSRFRDYALSVLEKAQKTEGSIEGYPELIKRCYPAESLARLDSLRRAWEEDNDGSSISELTWLALTSILRSCSPAGTAQWQYVLPNKRKAKVVDPYDAFQEKVQLMSRDMAERQNSIGGPEGRLYQEDARQCLSVSNGWADLVITSPPYVNNYDYADATRLEMSFWGEVQSWSDLHYAVRQYLVRSCTQHVAKLKLNEKVHEIVCDPLLEPIHSELAATCKSLEAERENHGGRKPYHAMVAAYFYDMARVFIALRRVTAKGSLVCFVIGDSAPYGIYVPVDRWLGELAKSSGFVSYRFEKTRDRNVKWKNRKHRVPLHEGRLWIKG